MNAFRRCLIASALILSATLGAARPPQRNLLVALREVVDDRSGASQAADGGAVWRTQRQAAPVLAAQQVQVLNGTRGSLQLTRAVPVQWVQAAGVKSAASSGSAAVGWGGSVVNAITWLESGQTLSVTPTWPGGTRPVRLEVAVSTASLEAKPGVEMPTQANARTVTTVSAAMGRWVTIAASGGIAAADMPGTVSTTSTSAEPRRLIQLRVLEAP